MVVGEGGGGCTAPAGKEDQIPHRGFKSSFKTIQSEVPGDENR